VASLKVNFWVFPILIEYIVSNQLSKSNGRLFVSTTFVFTTSAVMLLANCKCIFCSFSYMYTPSGLVNEVVLDKVCVKHWE
jgi:hypothetical protein